MMFCGALAGLGGAVRVLELVRQPAPEHFGGIGFRPCSSLCWLAIASVGAADCLLLLSDLLNGSITCK